MPRSGEPTWLQRARLDDGLQEIPGAASAPRILEMARKIGAPAWYDNDDHPWCAVGANCWLLEDGHPMAIGDRGDQYDRLRALTFLSYGQSLSGPALGAIAVFTGPTHVGFYLGECTETHPGQKPRRLIRTYGANQRNRVCAVWIDAQRLRGYRYPPRLPLPVVGPILLTPTGESISTSER